jgi:hypothetical protein
MSEVISKVCIGGREVPFTIGSYKNNGALSAATLTFTIPTLTAQLKKLWNKEVTFYCSKHDTVPLFRGWIKRTQINFNTLQVFAQDAIGYMVKGGNDSLTKVALTDDINIDGLTVGAAIKKLINLANMDDKVGTDYIGDTTPLISSSQKYIRGTVGVLDTIKQLLASVVDDSGSLPRPNIARLIDDGSKSQLIIELENTLDDTNVKHYYSEYGNITNLNIINRKVPTRIVVEGKDGVKGTFTHDSAIAALDSNPLQVSNDTLESPAECKEFAYKIFKANLKVQYEYSMQTFEGYHLYENDVINILTDDEKFSGNYRVLGKTIDLTNLAIKLTINRKPPTLAEYIGSRDN